jgi:hypothetical protein
MSSTTSLLPLRRRRIVRVLWIAAAAFALASLAGQLSRFVLGRDQVFGLVRLFNLDKEENVPTFYSIFLLACASGLLVLILLLEKRAGGRDVLRWAALALGFAFMGVDEGWSVHERLVRPVNALLGEDATGLFKFAWVVPALALIFLLGPFFLPFLLRLPRATRLRFVVSAALYLGGAIGMEMLGGRYKELHGTSTLTYNLLVTLEECLEMAGCIVFIRALLIHLEERYGAIGFQWVEREDARASRE